MTGAHAPVLLAEAIEALAITPDGRYIDATFGRGGHSAAILARLSPRGRLLVIDRDESAIAAALKGIGADSRVTAVKGRFSMMENIQANAGWSGAVDGVLFDLGVSSPQLDEPGRGFSFRAEGPLDMRMEQDRGEPASAWLGRASEADIAHVLRDFGEERFARRVARAIVRARSEGPVTTTRALAEIVSRAIPSREPGMHPATRSFQAIRIFINDELGELAAALPVALRLLRPGGRLAVISFHSLEDRCVKRFFQEEARGDPHPSRLPVLASAAHPRLRVIGRAQRPAAGEIAHNPRARSAVLRAAERIGGPL